MFFDMHEQKDVVSFFVHTAFVITNRYIRKESKAREE